MKDIVLKINRLGAIRDSQITLRPFMVFSGESRLGKSYLAFVVHYFYMLLSSDRLNNFFQENQYDFEEIIEDLKNKKTSFSIKRSDIYDWINKDVIRYLGYLLGHNEVDGDVEFVLPSKDDSFVFTFEEEISGLNGMENLYYKIRLNNYVFSVVANSYNPSSTPFVSLITAVLQNDIFDQFTEIQKSFILPPSRGALMELNEKPTFKSGMYDEFFSLKRFITAPNPNPFTMDGELSKRLEKLNSGKLQQEPSGVMYYAKNGLVIPLTAAASSLKELSPLSLLLSKVRAANISVLFEEPESHLHPIRQVLVADLLACMVNKGCRLQVTTHNDYLLNRINLLMQIYSMRLDPKLREKVDSVMRKWDISEDLLLNPDNIGAYFFERQSDGTSKIIDLDVRHKGKISYNTFYEAVEEDINISDDLDEISES